MPAGGPADGLADLVEERVGQLEDVVEPLAQRRQRDLEDAEPVVEVLAELAAPHRGVQVAVGRGDHADVGVAARACCRGAWNSRSSSTRSSLAWTVGRHLADLVEEQHAAAGLLDPSRLGRDRAGERAALVAEQLRFEQLVGQRRAVDGDERPVLAPRRRGG